ncbi:MAG: bifunctional serine/threonine-protein kinase/formylglycine-generating enzyme family protein [bacterium]|nr:bifunctional serine/threonine-protein kinase/formylglycine-generating enzyme family protein [bacterium]
MNDSQLERIKRLYDELCDQTAAQQRDLLAREADDTVREEVASLLRYDRTRGFLVSDPAPDSHADFGSGSTVEVAIEGFDDLEFISAGGMGSVFRARQREPQRTVAIKLLRTTCSESVAQRFQREAQFLARLDHPSIARVFSTGTIDAGFGANPYFVMEFVAGSDLLRATDGAPRRAKLELFASICEAVAYAHRRGVVHRDLKPDNILVVTDSGGAQLAKILDFGIAGSDGEDLDAMTRLTQTGQVFGTLPYMSPEQLAGDPAALDARVDVYALGAILFELLADTLPHDLDGTTALEAMRRVRDEEPRRLGTFDASLRGDLEHIVATALEKSRERRYASAADLAADVRRHLRDEPIHARSFGVSYHFRKFARRHRLLVATAGLLLSILTVTLIWSLVEADAAEAHLRDFDLLAWIMRCDDAEQAALALRPSVPGDARLSEWRALHGEPLLAVLPTIRADLAVRRAAALPRGEAPPDWVRLPGEQQLGDLRAELTKRNEDFTRLEGPEDAILAAARQRQTEEIEALKRRIADLEAAIEDRRAIRFASRSDAYVYDALTGLTARLTEFAEARGVLAEAAADAEQAHAERHAGSDRHGATWDEAIRAIAASDRYGRLRLERQVGLVPLGVDPSSQLWEFGHVRSGRLPTRDPDSGALQVDGETGLVFVLLPGGSTRVGAQTDAPGEPLHDPFMVKIDGPVHEVDLAPFFLSKFEMSKGQWRRLTSGEDPSYWRPGEYVGGVRITWAHPVEWVSWTRCDAVLGRCGLELPTEAQWEYGARGGRVTPWWTGTSKETLVGAANLADLTAKEDGMQWKAQAEWPEFRDGYVLYAAIDGLRPNPFGLHNVHGNVSEWCRDGGNGAPRDGDGLRPGGRGTLHRAMRGGSMNGSWRAVRLARRCWRPERSGLWRGGLRPARRVFGP